jgi:hypothetical protein
MSARYATPESEVIYEVPLATPTGHLSSRHPVVVVAVRGVGGCVGWAGSGVGVLRTMPVAGCVRVSSSVDHL